MVRMAGLATKVLRFRVWSLRVWGAVAGMKEPKITPCRRFEGVGHVWSNHSRSILPAHGC